MFMLKVTLAVQEMVHCGYCSDPFDVTDKFYKVTKVSPEFPHQDKFNEVTHINLQNPSLNYIIRKDIEDFAKSNFEKSNICNKGSGYCGCRTKYFVKKLKVIKAKNYSLP